MNAYLRRWLKRDGPSCDRIDQHFFGTSAAASSTAAHHHASGMRACPLLRRRPRRSLKSAHQTALVREEIEGRRDL